MFQPKKRKERYCTRRQTPNYFLLRISTVRIQSNTIRRPEKYRQNNSTASSYKCKYTPVTHIGVRIRCTLGGTTILYILFFLFQGAIQILEATLPQLLPILTETSQLIFGHKDSVFVDTTVHDFLFGGMKVCDWDKINTEKNPKLKIRAKLLCTILFATPIRNMKIEGKSLIFTFLGHVSVRLHICFKYTNHI